jgi:TrmH family RNA methyltransferase
MPEMITSAQNPLVKLIRSLRQKKGREETGLFLAEGIHHTGEAVEAGWEIEALVYSPELLKSDYAVELVKLREQWGTRCVALPAELLTSLAEKDNPQGLLAVVRQRRLGLEAIRPENIHLAAALVSPQDPGNVGTVLRTLDAVGGEGLFLLDGGVELYHPSVVRASMGMLFWLPVVQASFTGFAAWAKVNGIELVGTSAHAGMDYRQVLPENGRTILVFGSEQKGLTPEQLAACDVRVSMPMRGRASSLNLAVAAGILLYRWADNESKTNKRIINDV